MAAALAHETVQILDAGYYVAPSGRRVEIGEAVRRAVAQTVAYPPDAQLPAVQATFQATGQATRFEVCNETTLAAAERLARAGNRVVALNFASAKRPGGGFLNGALAQEESLARASALFACLNGNVMYAYHRHLGNSLYSNYAIYSPDVPVIRAHEETLLEEPYLCSFISAPAPNAHAAANRHARKQPAIRSALRERITKILSLGAGHGHDTIILGAWGCGVFNNDPNVVAMFFHDALAGDYRGVFRTVVFAVLDATPDARMISPFCRLFA